MSTQITLEKWREIRQAVELDDPEQFMKLVTELARLQVAAERSHAIRCERVRMFERHDGRPFFCLDR